MTDDNNDNPIITRPRIVLIDERQQQKSNHNTTRYCVYWWKTINPIIIRPHIVLTDRRQQRQPNHNTTLWLGRCCRPSVNTICGRIMIGLSLSSVSKHNMWSYYDGVVVVVVCQLTQYLIVLWLGCRCCRPLVSTIRGRVMIGLSLLSSVIKHNMLSYYDCVVVVFRQ
jgi:hypothetical protein